LACDNLFSFVSLLVQLVKDLFTDVFKLIYISAVIVFGDVPQMHIF